ncbi:MAG: TatD family hydrolase [Proteobacteria bacterium]|nr:TatD family hydrolase [Pseudomonadota bacterium]
MNFVDTHCHLNFPPLAGGLPAILQRARARGVTRVVVPAYDRASWDVVIDIAARHEKLYPALGLHPWVADEAIDFQELEAYLKKNDAVAVGEIGLDFKVVSVGRERQIEALNRQLEMAVRLDLPVLLHCRGAFQELLAILDTYRGRLKGVVHAFSRGPELAKMFVDRNMHVAFGGAVTREGAKRARRSAIAVPSNRLLLETDAPSIGLDGVEPENVEPHHVADIASALAELRGETVEKVARSTSENARDLFRLDGGGNVD